MTEELPGIGYDKLLPGEATASHSGNADDILHWLNVYTELCEFKEKLLRAVANQREHVSGEGRVEVESDEVMLQREADRLMRRLRFWQNRADEVKR